MSDVVAELRGDVDDLHSTVGGTVMENYDINESINDLQRKVSIIVREIAYLNAQLQIVQDGAGSGA